MVTRYDVFVDTSGQLTGTGNPARWGGGGGAWWAFDGADNSATLREFGLAQVGQPVMSQPSTTSPNRTGGSPKCAEVGNGGGLVPRYGREARALLMPPHGCLQEGVHLPDGTREALLVSGWECDAGRPPGKASPMLAVSNGCR